MATKREYELAHQLLDLVDAIDNGRTLTVNQIMSKCDVDRPAATRYLDFVKQRRPLEHEIRSGEKFWSRSVGKPACADFDEVVALELGLESARWLRGTPYFQLFSDKIDQVRNATDPTVADLLHRFVQSFHHRTQGDGTYSAHSDQIRVLLNAIRDRHVCRIVYQSHSAEVKEYAIHPLLLVLYKDRLYLFARTADKKERRCFALESISTVRADKDGTGFPPPSRRELDPSHVFEHSFGLYTDMGAPAEVVVEVAGPAAMALRRQKLHASQTLEELKDGWVRVTWRVAICPELRSYVLAQLPNVRVIAPDRLLRELRGMVENAFR